MVEAEVRSDCERAADLVDRAEPRRGIGEEVERAQQVDVGAAEEAHHRPADEAHVVVEREPRHRHVVVVELEPRERE